jgi:formate-dependent nitrite reductase membrane component NrfD
MLEITTTRANPLVDPQMHAWSWEIPVYLFLGGLVAGLMVLSGLALLRRARGEEPHPWFTIGAPLWGFVLMNLGMGALFLDLTHKLHVWAVYLAFQPASPMSWGSWILIVVYGALVLTYFADRFAATPGRLRALAIANVVLGVALGIYTGILLSTMVARPLWNSAVLGPLFLVSGLSAAAALSHLATREAAWARADVGLLAVELALIGLLVAGLATSSGAHQEAVRLLFGPYALAFWGGLVLLGIAVPMALQALELAHRIPHTIVAPLLVLAGGFALRWILVDAGQASRFIPF